MAAIAKGRLDPNKALDVCKFAAILGTPTQPLKCDKWLSALLKWKPPTFENKLEAVCGPGEQDASCARTSRTAASMLRVHPPDIADVGALNDISQT